MSRLVALSSKREGLRRHLAAVRDRLEQAPEPTMLKESAIGSWKARST